MLTSFRVQDFRGLIDLTVEPLDRVNLITGKNNTGKTALLEAIYLHCQTNNPRSVIDVSEFRGLTLSSESSAPVEEACGWLFPMGHRGSPANFASVDDNNNERNLQISISDPNDPTSDYLTFLEAYGTQIPTSQIGLLSSAKFTVLLRYKGKSSDIKYSGGFWGPTQSAMVSFMAQTDWKPAIQFLPFGRTILDQEVHQFSNIDALNRQVEILEPLRLLEPNLRRLSLLIFNGKPMIHGDIGLKRLMPITFIGEGFRRLLAIVLAIVNTQDGILLIDEIDAGLHHSILPQVFEAIGQAARASNVQVFATTHSYECIMAAHRAFDQHEPYDLRLHRLERVDGQIRAVTYDRETLETSEEMMLEVR